MLLFFCTRERTEEKAAERRRAAVAATGGARRRFLMRAQHPDACARIENHALDTRNRPPLRARARAIHLHKPHNR